MRVLLINDHHELIGGAEQYFFALKKSLMNISSYTVYSIGFGKTPQKGRDYTILKITGSKWSKLFWQVFKHKTILCLCVMN